MARAKGLLHMRPSCYPFLSHKIDNFLSKPDLILILVFFSPEVLLVRWQRSAAIKHSKYAHLHKPRRPFSIMYPSTNLVIKIDWRDIYAGRVRWHLIIQSITTTILILCSALSSVFWTWTLAADESIKLTLSNLRPSHQLLLPHLSLLNPRQIPERNNASTTKPHHSVHRSLAIYKANSKWPSYPACQRRRFCYLLIFSRHRIQW